ncbi:MULTISPECIES: cell division protein ZapA [Halomonadaceae]|uniref:cell division protein ZapA n=1 Tax=Halomonadaceae TaxID=28256 RepID=UPI001599E4D8|nr:MULTISPECIES: cell division protein ZapA [Halomonas]QJQ95569.1 cell division protein ZapA [Halomonas sp. PA5]
MTDETRPTTEITLLGQAYVIACQPSEQEPLKRAARYLDRAMQGIHSRGKVLGAEKVAIMAALNITHELLQSLEERKEGEASIARLNERLDKALHDTPPR